jgi:predicted metal-dependent hydrolase
MKKRSMTEVEVRNILSEMLLRSLRSRSEIKILNLILKYCDKTRDRSISRIYLKDLLATRANFDRVEFDLKKFSKDVLLNELLAFGPGDSIELKSRFAKYQTFICRKAKAYLKLISRLRTLAEGVHDELEDKVKIGVTLFNGGFFFECHEYLEEIWLTEKGRGKSFLKGLIHACVAFYHLEYENIRGMEKYLKRSSSRLKEFQPSYLGIDVRNFLSDIDKVLKVLEESKLKYKKEAIPTIKLID